MHHYIAGNIVDIINVTDRIKLFYWKPKQAQYTFIPGQFAIIHFPEIKSSMPYRSYSIAGLENNIVSFCISLKDGGAATEILWQKKIGNYLEITEAKGDFYLRNPMAKEVYFIATGTGIAPFKPMIAQALEINPLQSIHLIFGNRKEEDIIYHQTWLELEKEYDNIKYTPVLSQSNWAGAKGYVHPIYQNLFEQGQAAHFYLCGWQEMIKEARSNLKSMGHTRKQYFIESYN